MERLQKILSRAGIGSRRKCETLIIEGRVKVNGKIAAIGSKADSKKDRISVDDKLIQIYDEYVYLMLYKPRNVITSLKAQDSRKTARDLIPLTSFLYPVGRLDADSEGMLLFTNDGDLANRLTHPRYEHEKEYHVLVARHPDNELLDTWRKGVVIEDGFRTKPTEIRVVKKAGKGTWLSVILKEGHKRQIREVGKTLGLPVVRIIRIRMGMLLLGPLRAGQWRYLTDQEVNLLKSGTRIKIDR